MSKRVIRNPAALSPPLGQYSHVARVEASEFLFIAGALSVDAAGATVGVGDFESQCGQVFANIEQALTAENAGWGDVVQFTTYLVDRADIPKLKVFREREFPKFFPDRAYPPNTLPVVNGLVDEDFLIEVQAIAAV